MLTKRQVVSGILACFIVGLSALSFAEDMSKATMGNTARTGAAMSPMSPELQKNMADMYQKMADCLRTGKSNEDCQKQVAKDCPVITKTGQCPILEGIGTMGGSRGMGPKGMGSMGGPHKMR